jgi:hypothetical protein
LPSVFTLSKCMYTYVQFSFSLSLSRFTLLCLSYTVYTPHPRTIGMPYSI